MKATKASWQVTAGVIPGEPMSEHTKRWTLTSEEWDSGSEKGVERLMELQGKAMIYAVSLSHPAHVNWTHLEWVWY